MSVVVPVLTVDTEVFNGFRTLLKQVDVDVSHGSVDDCAFVKSLNTCNNIKSFLVSSDKTLFLWLFIQYRLLTFEYFYISELSLRTNAQDRKMSTDPLQYIYPYSKFGGFSKVAST